MKDRIDAILRRPQAEYLEKLLPPRDALLAEMEEFAAQNGHPIADPEVAQLMRILVRLCRPKHLLEVGTNIGYSVIVLGRECPSGSRLETIELNSGTLEVAREFVGRAALAPEVVFHQGPALEVIPSLQGPFDFVFIDCVKTEYSQYLEGLLPMLAPGALVVCDNLLWKGQVAEGPKSQSEEASTAALARFNAWITSDSRFESTILPLGDGVGLTVLRPARPAALVAKGSGANG
jgi:caffeoyl-CoA O-methyltransferase